MEKFYFAVLPADAYDNLVDPDIADILKQYVADAPPSAYVYEDVKWRKMHLRTSAEVSPDMPKYFVVQDPTNYNPADPSTYIEAFNVSDQSPLYVHRDLVYMNKMSPAGQYLARDPVWLRNPAIWWCTQSLIA